jgi:GLPGLI family protein
MSIIIVAVPAFLNGQDKSAARPASGKIIFEEKVKVEIKLEGDASQFESMIPKEHKTEKVLWFTEGATLFEDGVNSEDEMVDNNSEGVRIKMVVSGQNKLFTDLKNMKITDQRDFMNRIFLVDKKIPEINWKVTGEQKSILDHLCYEAVSVDTSGKKTIVWFDPAFPVKSGPAGLCNLPGMILEADIKGGATFYSAKSIEPVSGKDLKVSKPKEGKKVTESEFRKIVDEKMKEMGIENGGGNGEVNHVVISIRK